MARPAQYITFNMHYNKGQRESFFAWKQPSPSAATSDASHRRVTPTKTADNLMLVPPSYDESISKKRDVAFAGRIKRARPVPRTVCLQLLKRGPARGPGHGPPSPCSSLLGTYEAILTLFDHLGLVIFRLLNNH